MAALLDSPWVGQTFSPATPLDIATIEAAIVAQLQSYLAAALGTQMIEVTHFPDKPEAYELRHRIGVAMVIFAGAEYGKILDLGHVAQERTLEFEVGLRIRDLGWAFGGQPSGTSPGAYQILEAVRTALLGFQVNTGCTPMKAIRERFVDRDRQGGVWVYSIWFSTRTVVIENYSPPAYPPFVEGRFLEEQNGTAEIAGINVSLGGVTPIPVGVALLTFSGTPSAQTITLGEQNISALIVKSANLATTYVVGVDYALDNVNGIITQLSGGSIPNGATVAVSYAYSDVVTALASGGDVPFAPNN
jgi:hypothetical protein